MTNSASTGTETERDASPPHSRASREILEGLGVSAEKGLDAAEAERRLEESGPNALARDSRGGIPRILWRQINDPLMYVLLGSGTLAVLLGKGADSIVVFAVVVLNTIIGFVQKYRASRAIAALMDMVPDDVAVLRDGSWTSTPSGGVVPGDVVALVSGDKVPADARLPEVRGLQVDEAALTGESVPVSKREDPVPEDAPVADRRSMAYGGTLVSYGTATAVITATGMETELGRISSMLDGATDTETPLTRQISTVSKWITAAIAAVSIIWFETVRPKAPQQRPRPSPTTTLAASVSRPPHPPHENASGHPRPYQKPLRPASTTGRPARRARRNARSGRRARSSPRSVRFRIPRPKPSVGRPPLHREPA